MKKIALLLIVLSYMSACVKDDIVDDRVDPVLRITNPIDSLTVDSNFQLKALYLDEVGSEQSVALNWETSNSNVLTIDNSGLVTGVQKGNAMAIVRYVSEGIDVADTNFVQVDSTIVVQTAPAEKNGTVQTTSSYPLSGSYSLKEVSGGLELSLGSDYTADNSLPGLYIYLSNNNTTTQFAMEIGPVTVFTGAHTYFIPGAGINDYTYILYYCKPFNVKVGDGLIN